MKTVSDRIPDNTSKYDTMALEETTEEGRSFVPAFHIYELSHGIIIWTPTGEYHKTLTQRYTSYTWSEQISLSPKTQMNLNRETLWSLPDSLLLLDHNFLPSTFTIVWLSIKKYFTLCFSGSYLQQLYKYKISTSENLSMNENNILQKSKKGRTKVCH